MKIRKVMFGLLVVIFAAGLIVNPAKTKIVRDFDFLKTRQKRILECQNQKLRKEQDSLKGKLKLLKDRLETEKEADGFRRFFAQLLIEKFKKEKGELTCRSGIPIEAAITQKENGIEVLLANRLNSPVVSLRDLASEDFRKCWVFLKKEYSQKGLAIGEKRTIKIAAVFSRYPEMKVRFPKREKLEKDIRKIEARLSEIEKQLQR